MSVTVRRAVRAAWFGLASCAALALAGAARAGVVRLEIQQRLPYAEGREFPGVGSYERLLGRAYFAVDPAHAAQAGVVDLKLAPRNPQGLVEFSAELEILAPGDRSRARGTLFYDVNNRGNRMCLRMFNESADEFLMRQGYVVVWSGWLADLLPGEDRLRLDAPVARTPTGLITGAVRCELLVDEPQPRASVGGRPMIGGHRPVAERLDAATLTWRRREADPRVPIPRAQWRLETQEVSAPGGPPSLPRVELVVAGGLRPGYLYELIYEAQDPVVQGLGLVGIRDLVSFLKHDGGAGNPLAREGRSCVERAIGFGISQSGRCLRVLVREGFNADEQGRIVFEGLLPHVPGGGLGFFNHRFAAPSRYANQHGDHLYPCDHFPFTYAATRDPFTGEEQGILDAARRQGVVPKLFHVQNSAEYWHRAGSLAHTTPDGLADAEVPEEVRCYTVGGAQHGWGNDLPAAAQPGRPQENPTDYRPTLRALLTALEAWVREGTAPPASVYPRFADGTLVDWREQHSGWQALPGVRYPEAIQQGVFCDYGPEFAADRRITRHPPRLRGVYRAFVPACDEDNNEQGVIRMPTLAVPLGSYTGWALRDRSQGAEGELLALKGIFIPFARTAAQRQAEGDPRPALEERYRDAADYLRRFDDACRDLVARRYLLPEDAPRLRLRAAGLAKALWPGD